jgi:hypothetical protein
MSNFFNIFLFILQKYTTVSKFISFGHQTPWRTAVRLQSSLPTEGGTQRPMQPPWPTAVGFFKKFCKRLQMEELQT